MAMFSFSGRSSHACHYHVVSSMFILILFINNALFCQGITDTKIENNNIVQPINHDNNDVGLIGSSLQKEEGQQQQHHQVLRGEISQKTVVVDNNNKEERRLGYGFCDGDCDSDSDCDSGLYCYQRSDGDPCPSGCSWCPYSTDLCYSSNTGGGTTVVEETNVVICFSEVATVQVQVADNNKNRMEVVTTMKDLKVGDQVLTGKNRFQPIYAFGHYHPTQPTEFLQIHYNNIEGGDNPSPPPPLEISKHHMIYIKGNHNPVRAHTVKVGDALVLGSSINDESSSSSVVVTNISIIQRNGLYAPLTADGSIVVNGVITSVYASPLYFGLSTETVQPKLWPLSIISPSSLLLLDINAKEEFSHHDICHLALSPFRMICKYISPNICNRYNERGMPYMITMFIHFVHWAHRQSIGLQNLLALSLLILLIPCRLVEVVLSGDYLSSSSSSSLRTTTFGIAIMVITAAIIFKMSDSNYYFQKSQNNKKQKNKKEV